MRWPLAGWLLGCAGASVLFGVCVAALGQSPLAVLQGVIVGAFGSTTALNRTVARLIPLLLLSEGLILAFRARFWNIGLNGGMLIGAIVASGVALHGPAAPAWVILPLMLVLAIAGGALWSLIPALLRLSAGAPELIVSLMLNYVAARLNDFLIVSAWKDPNGRGFPGTATFNPAFWLPRLPDTNVHLGLLFGILAVIGIWLLSMRTVWGLEVDLLGQGPRAAQYLGLDTRRVLVLVSVISGGLAGLAGAGEVAGLNHRLDAGITQDLGYTAILVVSLGLQRPWPTAAAAIGVAAILSGGTQLEVQFALPAATAGVLLWAILYSVINAQTFTERWCSHRRRAS